MKLKEIFNLTKNELKIMETFMQKEILTTGEITKNTGISRPNCYDVLNKLIEKGLITKFTENAKVKYLINTINYDEVLSKKEEELKNLKSEIKEYNQKIFKTRKENENIPHVEIYVGIKGLQQFHKQRFNTTKITTFGAEGVLEEKYPHIWNTWIRKLEEQKTPLWLIYNEKNRQLRKKVKIPIIKKKYIQRTNFTNVTTQILDNQVNLFHWSEIPLIIAIKSKSIAKAYREEFNLMWKHSKK